MTREQSEEWFDKMRNIYGYPPSDAEEYRYQAFKARLAAESALNIFPEELK